MNAPTLSSENTMVVRGRIRAEVALSSHVDSTRMHHKTITASSVNSAGTVHGDSASVWKCASRVSSQRCPGHHRTGRCLWRVKRQSGEHLEGQMPPCVLSSASSSPSPLTGETPQVPTPAAQGTAGSSGGSFPAEVWAGRIKISSLQSFSKPQH